MLNNQSCFLFSKDDLDFKECKRERGEVKRFFFLMGLTENHFPLVTINVRLSVHNSSIQNAFSFYCLLL